MVVEDYRNNGATNLRNATQIILLLSLLLLAAGLCAYIWWSLGDVDLGTHGLVALILGSVATIGLGTGLMFLVFYSHRKGYDQQSDDG